MCFLLNRKIKIVVNGSNVKKLVFRSTGATRDFEDLTRPFFGGEYGYVSVNILDRAPFLALVTSAIVFDRDGRQIHRFLLPDTLVHHKKIIFDLDELKIELVVVNGLFEDFVRNFWFRFPKFKKKRNVHINPTFPLSCDPNQITVQMPSDPNQITVQMPSDPNPTTVQILSPNDNPNIEAMSPILGNRAIPKFVAKASPRLAVKESPKLDEKVSPELDEEAVSDTESTYARQHPISNGSFTFASDFNSRQHPRSDGNSAFASDSNSDSDSDFTNGGQSPEMPGLEECLVSETPIDPPPDANSLSGSRFMDALHSTLYQIKEASWISIDIPYYMTYSFG